MKYVAVFLVLVAAVAASSFPQPVGFVNDFANILPDRAEIEDGLVAYEQNTTIEAVVVTIDALPPEHTSATYAVELFQEWGIGKRGEDNGLLILIIENGTVGNRMRIEVGYGLQGYVTGAEAGRILDEALPFYEQGDYQAAVDTILIGLSDELENYVPSETAGNDNWDVILFDFLLPNLPIVIFIAFIVISATLSSRCPYCFGSLSCSGDYCTCKKCGRKITKKRRFVPVLIGGSGAGGFGGFGGGSSGGGGAGR